MSAVSLKCNKGCFNTIFFSFFFTVDPGRMKKTLLMKQLNKDWFRPQRVFKVQSRRPDLFTDSFKPHITSARKCMAFAILFDDLNLFFPPKAPVFVCCVHPKIHHCLFGFICFFVTESQMSWFIYIYFLFCF